MKALGFAGSSAAIALALGLATSANAATQTFDVGSFSAIDIAAGVEADVTVGGAQSVSVATNDDDFKTLIVEVRGDTLRISRKTDILRWGSNKQFKATISVPSLNSVEASSGANVEVTGVSAGDFSADLSSGAFASVAGSCDTLRVDMSSGANFRGEDLRCSTVYVDGSSGANASVYASDRVVGDVSSGAMVRVSGNPADVDKDTSSGGSIRLVD